MTWGGVILLRLAAPFLDASLLPRISSIYSDASSGLGRTSEQF